MNYGQSDTTAFDFMPEHVIVVSHRRSGTHLTIDAIRNNFEAYNSPYVNLDELRTSSQPEDALESVRHLLHAPGRVVKSHSPADIELYFRDQGAGQFVRDLTGRAKILYVYRDGRDVMTSFYHYARNIKTELSSVPFSKFLRMRDPLDVNPSDLALDNVEYWKYHVTGWLQDAGVLPLSFESLIFEYEQQIGRLSTFLGQPKPRTIVDVVRSSDRGSPPRSLWSRSREKMFKVYKRLTAGVEWTSVDFAQGRVGSYKDVFGRGDLEYFGRVAGDLMERLGYGEMSTSDNPSEFS